MFDGIARRYDLTNDVISLGQDRRWRRLTIDAVGAAPGDKVLDLAAGTGTSSEPFADAGVRVVPCDFSIGMLAVGKARRPDLSFTAGDAMRLPFADSAFDAVTISFGLRNVVDTVGALREMLRVTRPGGRIVVAEFSTPTWSPFRTVYQEYLMKALPRVAGLVTKDAGRTSTLRSPSRRGRTRRSLRDSCRRRAGGRSRTATCRAASSRSTGRRGRSTGEGASGTFGTHRWRRPLVPMFADEVRLTLADSAWR